MGVGRSLEDIISDSEYDGYLYMPGHAFVAVMTEEIWNRSNDAGAMSTGILGLLIALARVETTLEDKLGQIEVQMGRIADALEGM